MRALLTLSAFALGLLGSPGARAQECPEGVISRIFIDNRPIFEDREIESRERFRWAYRTVNALHMETGADFIRSELLLREGRCFDPVLMEESERILRQYPFLGRVEIFSIFQSDGTRHVVVDTKDDWTTNASVSTGEGFLGLEGARITEENVLGRGIVLGLSYRSTDFSTEWEARFETPRLLSTRWDLRLRAGERRAGQFFDQELVFPFLGQVGRKAARQRWAREEVLFNFEVPEGERPYHRVLLPLENRSAEATFAMRLGPPRNLTTLGVGLSRDELHLPDLPGGLLVQRPEDDGAFSPADSVALEAVRPQLTAGIRTRVNLLVGQRNVRFVKRRGLDALQGEQDVQVGTDFAAVLGRSVNASGTEGLDEADDLTARMEFQVGYAPGRWVLTLEGGVEGRRVSSTADSLGDWRDIFADLDAFAYYRPSYLDGHTFLLRLGGTGGWSTVVPYQLTLGGETRLRGLRADRFPGGRRLVASLEDRVYIPWPRPELFDFGLTGFVDVGRMWDGDVPFGSDSGTEVSLGLGLRVGFPQGTGSVARLDFAYPVTGDGSLVVRVSVREVLGLLAGFEDEQVRRSRRVGLGSELIVLPTQGRPGRDLR